MTLLSKELLKNIRRIQITAAHTVEDALAGAYHSAFKGRGIEFSEVRDYQPGDDIRSIDWNVTARMNHPYIKNFKEERDLTVMLVVDISASTRFGSCQKSKSDLIAEVGAVLALSAIKNNDRVGLILFSDIIEKYLPPKNGLQHILRLIRELLAFKPKGTGTNIGSALHFLGNLQRRRGVCFLISDFIHSTFKQEATLISKRHDLISIALADPHEKQLPNIGLTTLKDLETGQNYLVDTSDNELQERLSDKTLQRLNEARELMKRLDSGYIEIHTDKSYIEPIQAFFKLRQRRR